MVTRLPADDQTVWGVARLHAVMRSWDGAESGRSTKPNAEEVGPLFQEARALITAATDLRLPNADLAVLGVERPTWALLTLEDWRSTIQRMYLSNAPPPERGFPGSDTILGRTVGGLAGWLAQVSLGQYDVPLPRDSLWQGLFLWLPQNVESFAARFGLERAAAIRWVIWFDSVAHAVLAQQHVRARVSELAARYPTLITDEDGAAQLREGVIKTEEGRVVVDDARMVAWPPNKEQRPLADELGRIRALLNATAWALAGHDGAPFVGPIADLREALRKRRTSLAPRELMPETYFGFQVDEETALNAENFVTRIVAKRGPRMIGSVWKSAKSLPSGSELIHPDRWVDRMGNV